MGLSERQNFGLFVGPMLNSGTQNIIVYQNDGRTGLVLRKMLGNFTMNNVTVSTVADVAVALVLVPAPLTTPLAVSITDGQAIYADPKNVLWSAAAKIKHGVSNINFEIDANPGRSLHAGYTSASATSGDRIYLVWNTTVTGGISGGGVVDLFFGEED